MPKRIDPAVKEQAVTLAWESPGRFDLRQSLLPLEPVSSVARHASSYQ